MRKLSFNSFIQEALTYSKVINADTVNGALLFASVNDWFVNNSISTTDVIQIADNEAGIIIGKGSIQYKYSEPKMMYQNYEGHINFLIKVFINDNQLRVELTNFMHVVLSVFDDSNSLGLITTGDVYTQSGLFQSILNNLWSDIKAKSEQFSKGVFNSLEKKIEQKKDIKESKLYDNSFS